jgi:hypothetical protein
MAGIVQSPTCPEPAKSHLLPAAARVAELRASFAGPVRCTPAPDPLGLTLTGQLQGTPPGPGLVAFHGAAPADIPATLTDVRVEQLARSRYRIAAQAREWLIEAQALHVHRDVGEAFCRAIPPRPVPWRRRLFWRVVLWLAASHRGMALLRRLRGRREPQISGGG